MRELLGTLLGSSFLGSLLGLGGFRSSLGDLGHALFFLGLVLGGSSFLLGLLGFTSGLLGVLLGTLFLGGLLGSALLGGLGGLLGGGSLLGGLLGCLALLELVGGGTELVGEALDASAVSTNFCWPVKNGWHSLHRSTTSSGLVERVLKVLPQLQRTVHST